MTPQIKTVSFSRLQDFEKCKYLAKLKYIDRVPEPERPLPPGKTEHAHTRGSRIHDTAELYVRGGVELAKELDAFKEDYAELRQMFSEGLVTLEEEWAVNQDWTPVAWASADAWCRMKLDAMVRTSSNTARVIDYKTGRRQGNEVKHTEQGHIYQLATFLRFPEFDDIVVEFWYLDLGEKDVKRYSRAQGVSYFEKYHNRLKAISDCNEFTPNPNAFTCKWCAYRGNACEYGFSGISSGSKFKSAGARINELRRGYNID